MSATSDPQLEQLVEDAAGVLLSEARDRILRALRRQPWISLERVSELARLEEDLVEPVLDELLDEDLVDQAHGRWAIEGARRPPATRYGKRDELTDSAKRLLEIVREDPWQRASTYAEHKGCHRNGAYSQLDHLTEHGLLTMTVHDGVKHWGPADQEPPEGHMKMQPGARSPKRQAIGPRALALLATDPWQTVSAIADQLGAARKSVDTRMRNLLTEGKVRREQVPYHGSLTVYAYALPESPELAGDDRDRIVDEQLERLPDDYFSTQDKVLKVLDRHPWWTARQITDRSSYNKSLTMGKVQAALSSLREKGRVQRVADDVYRYALPGAELTRTVSGRLKRGGDGSEKLEAVIDRLSRGNASTDELREHVEQELGKPCPGLQNQLNKAERDGILGKQRATRGSGRNRVSVTSWYIEERPTPDPSDLLGELEHAASQLREQGWTVDVHVEHPQGGGVPI